MVLFGCAARSRELEQATSAGPAPSASRPAPDARSAEPAAPPDPTLLVTEPRVLAELERQGLTLSGVLGGKPEATANHELGQLAALKPVWRVLEQELERVRARDKLAGVDVARFSHRLFDGRFLRLPQARFALAGVVNRPDRAPFEPGSCGETRLIYRLEYALDAQRASKLPMTLGIELPVASSAGACRDAAARWLEPVATDPAARAAWLRSSAGPLAPSRTRLDTASGRLVLYLQLVRWPATVRPDLGGHAEYLLRSFRTDAAGLLQP
ncbi:MAG TPA: hypothetical protein VIW29_21275, partial [Polyangiaceae bacterium]